MKTPNQLMTPTLPGRTRPGFLPSANPFAAGVTRVLLLLCLWLMPAVPIVNAAAGGTVVAWGSNGSDQTTVPAGLSGVTAIAAGAYHTVALKSDGTVVAWGYNAYDQTTVPAGLSGVTAIAAGRYHTVALVASAAPVITSLTASPAVLWPPNHKLITVNLAASVIGGVGAVTGRILSVSSNEPDNGLGDGDTAGDIVITSPGTVSLRAERSAKGSGRIYTILFEVKDAAGNTSTKTVTVSVPLNQGK